MSTNIKVFYTYIPVVDKNGFGRGLNLNFRALAPQNLILIWSRSVQF